MVTVGPPDSPEFQLVLTVPGPPKHDEETAAMLRSLVAKGALGVGAWRTDDCRKTFEEYSSRGVEFIADPAERPYGVEAVFRDPFGNWYSLNKVNQAACDAEAMKQSYPDR